MRLQNARALARRVLGGALVSAGVSHLTFARRDFQAQVPDFVPLRKDTTVVLSGIVEVALGSALLLTGPAHRETVGNVAAAFFAAVFPGNVAQYLHRRNAFGLDTDRKRFARLFFQPVLIYGAWASTRTDEAAGAR